MKSCAAICSINNNGGANANGFQLKSGNSANVILLNLTHPLRCSFGGSSSFSNDDFTSPIFDLIGSAFTRYRVNSLKFHYEPQAAATLTERLVFAFAPDPVNPVLVNTSVTADSCLAMADSVAFAPWRTWSMDLSSTVRGKLFYTFSDTSTSQVITERFSDFGVIACLTSSTGAVSQCGVLYMEIDVELVEFCPIVVTHPASKRMADLSTVRYIPKDDEKPESSDDRCKPSVAPFS